MPESELSVRHDGYLFSDDYLATANPEVAENYLWPIPTFGRDRDRQVVQIGATDIRPGDVLEVCGTDWEEYLLVVTVLPDPTIHDLGTVVPDDSRILCYSSSTQSYRVLDTGPFSDTHEDGVLYHSAGTDYVVHEAAGPILEDDGPVETVATAGVDPVLGIEDPRERVSEKFAHHTPENPICPSIGVSDVDTTPLDPYLDMITTGDAYEVLKGIEKNSVHSWVTSPPYHEQRDYNVDGQLGQEVSVAGYLEDLLSIVNQLMRVTRNDGTGWIVVDDSYEDGALAGIPDRLVWELKTEGYDVIHNGPWTKTTTKPDPAGQRFSHAHERIIGIANSEEDHFFNKRAVNDPTDVIETSTGATNTDHDAVYPVDLPKRLIRATTPEHVCPDCGAPLQPEYSVTDIRDLPPNRDQCERALELAAKHDLSDDHLWACRAIGLGDTGQSARTQSGTGRNSNTIEELYEEAKVALGSYTREFTMARKQNVAITPTCDCPGATNTDPDDTPPGVVLDPFIGSGSSAIAAESIGRDWVGIELNSDYAESARERIASAREDADHIPSEEQETLRDFVS